MEQVLFNDYFIDRVDAYVDIEDRGYQFGDGIYEVIRTYSGESFMLDRHLERFKSSAEKINLRLPHKIEKIKEMIEKLKNNNNLKDGTIYVQLTRGTSSRTHGFPESSVPSQLIAYTQPLKKPYKKQREGVYAILTEDIRWLRCDIKSLNLLGNVLVKQKAIEKECFEAIQHRDDLVTEGSSTNVFIVKDNCLYTHPITNLILNDITRCKVLELANTLKINIKEEAFSTQQLFNADEVFITSTTAEIMPIIKIDEKQINCGFPGVITKKIQENFEKTTL